MAAADLTSADYQAALQALLPHGRVWPREPDAVQSRVAAGLAQTAARLHARANYLLRDAFPLTPLELLPEWEATLGLPDECSPNFSFSRNGPARYVDANGVLRTAAAGELRYSFGPDGTVLGPLIETASANTLLWSEALDRPVWSKSASLQVTPNVALAPDGTMTADRLTTTATSAGYVLQAQTIAAGGRYALSWHLKPGTQTWCYIQISTLSQTDGLRVWFDLANRAPGRKLPFGAGVTAEVRADPLADGWVRVSISGTVDDASTTVCGWIVPCSGDFTTTQIVGGTLDAWGAQFEPGSTSSYIPTAGAPASREADHYYAASVEQRQAAVAARFVGRGGQSVAYYTGVAAALGYQITITQFAPAVVGRARIGDSLNGAGWAHVWRVNAPETTVLVSRVGSARIGDRLREWGNNTLECALSRIKPAHTVLQFAYGG